MVTSTVRGGWILGIERWRWYFPSGPAPSFDAAIRWANRWATLHADRLATIKREPMPRPPVIPR
jgi:hypothetical protein